MVDTRDLKSRNLRIVRVQVPLPVPDKNLGLTTFIVVSPFLFLMSVKAVTGYPIRPAFLSLITIPGQPGCAQNCILFKDEEYFPVLLIHFHEKLEIILQPHANLSGIVAPLRIIRINICPTVQNRKAFKCTAELVGKIQVILIVVGGSIGPGIRSRT